MKDEYDSLIKNETWDLVEPPSKRSLITCKWVYKIKRKTDGSVERYKARLVARGYSQKAGLDYEETFSPVVRLESIRLILSIVSNDDLEMIHFDVKTAFLHGSLNEEIYMHQPQGFITNPNLACRLRKSLYGLKQASREWNRCFVTFLRKFELTPTTMDNCILTRKDITGRVVLIVAIYVDDGLVCSSDKWLLEQVVSHLKSKFDITIMDSNCFVGLQVIRDRKNHSMLVHQQYYIEKVIKKFELHNAKIAPTPMENNIKYCKAGTCDVQNEETISVPYKQAIGSLIYVSNGTRPDISFAVSKLASYSDCVKPSHWSGVKRVIRYLKMTSDIGICYKPSDTHFQDELIAYADSDFAGDIDSKKSTSGVLLQLNCGPIIWKSCKQSTVSTSTTNAEFIAASITCSEIIWVRSLLKELGRALTNPTLLPLDNQSAIKLITNQQIHTKIKHIDVKYMFIREAVERKEIRIEYIETSLQLADILTKPLSISQFNNLRSRVNLKSIEAFKQSQTC